MSLQMLCAYGTQYFQSPYVVNPPGINQQITTFIPSNVLCSEVPNVVEYHWMVFRQIFNTELNHRGSWNNARTTYIVFTVNKTARKIIKNSKIDHAEIVLVNELSGIFEADMAMEDMHVEVYMNNSPCRDCAERLLEFLTSHRRANITIHFSNLYKIWRKSCIMERCKHWLAVKRIDSNDNADGLRMLMDHRRCNIQPFDCKAWLDLMGILHIQSPEFEQIYMYQNDGNDRSREKEDTLLQKDLNLITDQEMCMEEEVFYQLFSLQGTMIIVYIVNNENRARFSTRAFHGETKDEEEFRRDLEKTYTLKKESEEMHVDIYMLLNDNRCRMLTNFLRQHRKAFFRIYATELGRFQKTSLRQLMDHERCKVNALEFQTWSSLISILGPPIPDFEEEYKSRREKEDIYIKKELTDIYNQDQ